MGALVPSAHLKFRKDTALRSFTPELPTRLLASLALSITPDSVKRLTQTHVNFALSLMKEPEVRGVVLDEVPTWWRFVLVGLTMLMCPKVRVQSNCEIAASFANLKPPTKPTQSQQKQSLRLSLLSEDGAAQVSPLTTEHGLQIVVLAASTQGLRQQAEAAQLALRCFRAEPRLVPRALLALSAHVRVWECRGVGLHSVHSAVKDEDLCR